MIKFDIIHTMRSSGSGSGADPHLSGFTLLLYVYKSKFTQQLTSLVQLFNQPIPSLHVRDSAACAQLDANAVCASRLTFGYFVVSNVCPICARVKDNRFPSPRLRSQHTITRNKTASVS